MDGMKRWSKRCGDLSLNSWSLVFVSGTGMHYARRLERGVTRETENSMRRTSLT